MDELTRERLFGYRNAFDHPVTFWAIIGILGLFAVFVVSIRLLFMLGRITRNQYEEMWLRWKSMIWLAVATLGPILLGAAWVMAGVALLSLLCFREFARVTGLFREGMICAVVGLGILLVTFASVDHYDRLFFASASMIAGLIGIITIFVDRPKGYVQRVALGVLGFLLFGFSLGYLGYIANDSRYRPILLMILLGVVLNDFFAYCIGKAAGGPKLIRNTSPGKTISGAVGALVLTTALVGGLGHFIFKGTAIDSLHLLLLLGFLVASLGQLGDLMVSSIKRDIGIKDMGVSIPGHGGVLDRFDSLVLVPPAVFHFLSLILGPLGSDQPARIISGG